MKVLEVKFTKIDEEFSEGRIVYQNEKVLRRGDVSDWDAHIYSISNVEFDEFEKHFYIKGVGKCENVTFLIRNKFIETLKKNIDILNKKHNRKHIWYPAYGDRYYYYDIEEEFAKRANSDNSRLSKNRIKSYLAFPNLELAHKTEYLGKLERMQLLYQYQNNLIFETDFEEEGEKYVLQYNPVEKKFICVQTNEINTTTIYWKNAKDLLEFINNYSIELRRIFLKFKKEERWE